MNERDSDTESSTDRVTATTTNSDRPEVEIDPETGRPKVCFCDGLLIRRPEDACSRCQELGFETNAYTNHPEPGEEIEIEIEDPGADNYDPHQYVPEFFGPMTASGLVKMHEALNDDNAANLRTEHPAIQAYQFWNMVESGTITPANGHEQEGSQ